MFEDAWFDPAEWGDYEDAPVYAPGEVPASSGIPSWAIDTMEDFPMQQVAYNDPRSAQDRYWDAQARRAEFELGRAQQGPQEKPWYQNPLVILGASTGLSTIGGLMQARKNEKREERLRAERDARQRVIDNPGGQQYSPLQRVSAVPSPADLKRYGYGPQQRYFDQYQPQPVRAAQGGMPYARGGMPPMGPLGAMGQGQVRGPGSGLEDKIPALLSDGEYVMDAATVSDIGDGSTDEGARRLDAMREKVRKHRRGKGNSAKKVPPKAKRPEQYMRGRP